MNNTFKNFGFLLFLVIAGSLLFYFSDSTENQDSSTKVAKILNSNSDKVAKAIEKTEDDTPEDSDKAPELILLEKGMVSPGLTLIPRYRVPEITLINHQGEIINSWEVNARRARLLPNCNLLVVHKKYEFVENGRERNTAQLASEYNWEGQLINEYPVDGEIHHDVQLLSTDEILLLHRYFIPNRDPKLNYRNILNRYPKYSLKYDAIQITDLHSKQKVFEWDFLDSFKATGCGNFECPWKSKRFIRSDEDHIDWSHVNSVTEVPENKWYDEGYQEFKPGNLMIMVRNWSAILILDRHTKNIVWEYGGEQNGGFEGGHDANMIPKGYPGAGNILIFDNGDPRLRLDIHTGVSQVKEFNPVTKEQVWIFDDNNSLLSISMGSAQRLKNGNTLISEDTEGRVIEVTPDKKIVWHYAVNRHTARAYRYEPGYCEKF